MHQHLETGIDQRFIHLATFILVVWRITVAIITQSYYLKCIPLLKKNKICEEYEDCFKDISEYREINDILFISDILVSDYSSLIYEFASFKRPMLFYAFDLENYTLTRDFMSHMNHLFQEK